MADQGQVILKEYQGGKEATAAALFKNDSVKLAAQGYFPTSQSWAPGRWEPRAFLLALLLCFIFIGFLVFIYMLVVKPEGTLTVTYQRRTA